MRSTIFPFHSQDSEFFEESERFISAKVKTSDLGKTIDFVRTKWEKFAPNMPFEYSFLDDDFNKLYINEERTQKLSFIFSFLAIFILSLGMFVLASYISEQRIKEIGIRKVLGAKVSGLVYLFSKEFLLKVIIANIIAWPAAYFSSLHETCAKTRSKRLWTIVLRRGSAIFQIMFCDRSMLNCGGNSTSGRAENSRDLA